MAYGACTRDCLGCKNSRVINFYTYVHTDKKRAALHPCDSRQQAHTHVGNDNGKDDVSGRRRE